jgi:hypothetical protein
MIWKARTKSVGDWTEVKIAVARDGQHFSWTGQLMIHPDEWRDFAERLGLREGDGGVWRTDDPNTLRMTAPLA